MNFTRQPLTTYRAVFYDPFMKEEKEILAKVKKGHLIMNEIYYQLSHQVYENWLMRVVIDRKGMRKNNYRKEYAQQNCRLYSIPKTFCSKRPIDFTTYRSFVLSLCYDQLKEIFYLVSIGQNVQN